MYVQGKCYKCGGILAVDDTQDASVCPFCSKPFIVEKAIQAFNGAAVPDVGSGVSAYSHDSDFVVERSVMIRFNGFTKKEVIIPEGITVIGNNAFEGMNNIESVHIPEGVEVIKEGAFSGCKNLKSVNIPDSVETVGADAFNGCSGLSSVSFPNSVKSIGAGALAGCACLENVELSQNIEQLPWRVFDDCISLKSITIPKKVKTIDDLAFAECVCLEEISFESSPSNTEFPVGVVRIGMNAFRNCKSLSTVSLPDTLKYIGNEAFRGCSKLKDIVIPGSVKAIYPLAFADCTNLEHVSFIGDTELYKGSNPYKYELSSATFYNCPKLLTVNYDHLQRHYWAFPAYMRSLEPVNIQNGRCRYCGGEFKGIFEKVCSVCGTRKDY